MRPTRAWSTPRRPTPDPRPDRPPRYGAARPRRADRAGRLLVRAGHDARRHGVAVRGDCAVATAAIRTSAVMTTSRLLELTTPPIRTVKRRRTSDGCRASHTPRRADRSSRSPTSTACASAPVSSASCLSARSCRSAAPCRGRGSPSRRRARRGSRRGRGELRPYVVQRVVEAVAGQGRAPAPPDRGCARSAATSWSASETSRTASSNSGTSAPYSRGSWRTGGGVPHWPAVSSQVCRARTAVEHSARSGRQSASASARPAAGASRRPRGASGRSWSATSVRPGRLGVPQDDEAAQRARSGARDHEEVRRPMSRVSSSPRRRSA